MTHFELPPDGVFIAAPEYTWIALIAVDEGEELFMTDTKLGEGFVLFADGDPATGKPYLYVKAKG